MMQNTINRNYSFVFFDNKFVCSIIRISNIYTDSAVAYKLEWTIILIFSKFQLTLNAFNLRK